MDLSVDAHAHSHVAECRENPLHGRGEQGVYVAQPEWERAQHQRKQRLVRAHLADATHEHRTAVLEHLRPHGIGGGRGTGHQ